jgi:hypothetical protein
VPSSVASASSSLFEEHERLAVADLVALLDRGVAERLREVTFAAAGWTEKQDIGVRGDEARGGELVDERAVHLAVEIEVEGVERLAGVAKARLLAPALQEPIATAGQLVADEHGEEVEWRQAFDLRLLEAHLDQRGDAAEAEMAECFGEFGERHGQSSVGVRVWAAMRSRYWVSSRMSGSIWRSASGGRGQRSKKRRTKR